MDAKRFKGKHGMQRNFNKQQLRHNKPSAVDVSPYTRYTSVVKLNRPEQARDVTATYTCDPVEAEAWLRNNVIDVNERALGFDMEWKPQFVKKKLGGKENRTAVLQLSTETSCLVLHIIHVKIFPRFLDEIIASQDVVKVGCGIRQDINKLFKDTGLRCKGAVDLSQLAGEIGCTKEQGLSLKALSNNLLQITMDKPKRIQMSNWETFPLHWDQIQYAALDAWIGIKLYFHIKKNLGDSGKIAYEPDPVMSRDPKLLETVYCDVCGKKCIGQSGLQGHLAQARHTACTQCGQMFVCEVSKKHLRKCSLSQAPQS